MHLEHKTALKVLSAKAPVHPDHGDLDDVRRSSLDRCVHGNPLSEGPAHEVGFLKLRDRSPAAIQCFRITLFFRPCHSRVQKCLDPRKCPEILFDKLRRFLPCDRQSLAQAK